MGPDCHILASYRFAENPSILDSAIIPKLQALQDAAERLNPGVHVWYTQNPEPDRSDRSYSGSSGDFDVYSPPSRRLHTSFMSRGTRIGPTA